MLREAILVMLLGLVSAPTSAQPSFVADLLASITARITVTNMATGEETLCQGFVYLVQYYAFVPTAKHCLDEMTSVPFDGNYRRLPDLSVNIQYANGTVGQGCEAFSARDADVLVLKTAFTTRPESMEKPCRDRDCKVYTTSFLGHNRRIPVMSVLSAGGGSPVVSSGVVFVDDQGTYTLALPSSPGTSGAPIFDMVGNLVGIVVAGYMNRSAQAGWITDIALGKNIHDLVVFAFQGSTYDDILGPVLPCELWERRH